MKKYFILLILLLTLLLQVSCNNNFEIKKIDFKGDILTTESVYKIKEDYALYKKNNSIDFFSYKQWYELNYVVKIKYNTDSSKNAEIILRLSGKSYESYLLYDNKMKLDLEMDISGKESENLIDATLKMETIYIKGCTFNKYKLKTISNNNGDIKKNKEEKLLRTDLSNYFKILDLDNNLIDLSNTNILFENYLEKALNPNDTDVYGKIDNTYYYDSSLNNMNSRVSFDIDEKYQIDNFKIYSYGLTKNYDDDFEEVTIELYGEVNKINNGPIIKLPSNYQDYELVIFN